MRRISRAAIVILVTLLVALRQRLEKNESFHDLSSRIARSGPKG